MVTTIARSMTAGRECFWIRIVIVFILCCFLYVGFFMLVSLCWFLYVGFFMLVSLS